MTRRTTTLTHRVRRAGVLLVGAAVLAVVGCGQGTPPGGTTPTGAAPSTTSTAPPSPSTTPSATRSSPAPARTAYHRYTTFLRRAAALDAQVRVAAQAVNGDFHAGSIEFTPATVDTVIALQPGPLVRSLPAGAPGRLERASLEVYANLVGRADALRVVVEYSGRPVPRSSQDAKDILVALGHGSTPARNFAADLAALRDAARRTADFEPAPPASRTAGSLAVRAAYVTLANGCSAEYGSWVPRPFPVIDVRWGGRTPPWDGVAVVRGSGDGTGLLFDAAYHASHGWTVNLNAC